MKFLTLDCTNLPTDLQSIVFCFAYNVKNIDQLNQFATFAWLNSKEAPIPLSWKKLLKPCNKYEFNWKVFLKTTFDPFAISTLIELFEVRRTVELLNWHYLKQLNNAACIWVRSNLKSKVLQELESWSPTAASHIFLLQRLLCCIDLPKGIKKLAFYSKSKCLVVESPLPLSFSINPPRFGIY